MVGSAPLLIAAWSAWASAADTDTPLPGVVRAVVDRGVSPELVTSSRHAWTVTWDGDAADLWAVSPGGRARALAEGLHSPAHTVPLAVGTSLWIVRDGARWGEIQPARVWSPSDVAAWSGPGLRGAIVTAIQPTEDGVWVGTDGGGLAVDVRDPANLGGVSGSVTGSVQLEVPSTYDLPTFATGCLEVSAPGQAFDGAKLFASHVPVAPWGWANRLEFRLLADPNLSASDAAKLPLDTLQVATGSALFDVLALDWYETATHTVQWDTWHNSTAIKNQLPQVGVYGLPFVVIADGQRVYLGAFMSMASSVALDMPVILLENMQDSSFAIEPAYPGSTPPTVDVRMDPRIMNVLEASGKLVK